ncbi:damage-inducible protein DinB [Mucilaginibacter limnophilus]|uniref:Damage-inducible protein DinB n=1 Tax=Mucilaginibacter limnophilus TaxID=1932778 RepID=A0A3S2V7Q9_9SPHI|nr:DinB family protein [Mucilaginibacter limnophilus]RVU00593.1 damage-inducible protein DinB [Mucilaginibacter limnophilus]
MLKSKDRIQDSYKTKRYVIYLWSAIHSGNMKEYFLPLFDYDRHCNELMLELIIKAGSPEKPVKLMAHILGAQQVWLNRCNGLANAYTVPVWPDWQVEELSPYMKNNPLAWAAFLAKADFTQRIVYKTSQGAAFDNTVTEILTHVINHGTHHRAQIGQHLKLAGIEELPLTDYIFWVRGQR